jgi:virulence factor Mce-like protein
VTRRAPSSIVSSPVLVGAITTLIVIVAVFLAYNANEGLPFVPTYDLHADLPSASNLVHGDEVRVGGFRVGIVSSIGGGTVRTPKGPRPVARVDLKLDKTVEPLPRDSRLHVRPVSSIGLKYVELTPGLSPDSFPPGSTIPLANATKPVEFDDLLNTFTAPTRVAQQAGLTQFGDALAGRGESINEAIARFAPFFGHLTPVMSALNAPSTRLSRLLPEIARTSTQVAPVAVINALLFGKMADTLDAIGHDPAALTATIRKAPPTEITAISSFRVERPFLADLADLSGRLLPDALELRPSLPPFTAALAHGSKVLPLTPPVDRQTGQLYAALDDVARRPETLPALRNLSTLTRLSSSLFGYVAPYQTVCNYATYQLWSLAGQLDEEVPGGTAERVGIKTDNGEQVNRVSSTDSFRAADVPFNENPKGQPSANNRGPLEALHGQAYAPAVDHHGNADCQTGQTGYPKGPFGKGRYRPHNADPNFDQLYSGGSHVFVGRNTPILSGPTFKGVPNLKDVP